MSAQEQSLWERTLFVVVMIVLGPSLLLFAAMGFDFGNVEKSINPILFLTDARYRQTRREYWRQHSGVMWKEISFSAALLILGFVTLCLYYALYSLIRYGHIPSWMSSLFCFFSGGCN